MLECSHRLLFPTGVNKDLDDLNKNVTNKTTGGGGGGGDGGPSLTQLESPPPTHSAHSLSHAHHHPQAPPTLANLDAQASATNAHRPDVSPYGCSVRWSSPWARLVQIGPALGQAGLARFQSLVRLVQP